MFDHGEFSIVSKRNKVNEYLFRTIFRGISALSSYKQGVYNLIKRKSREISFEMNIRLLCYALTRLRTHHDQTYKKNLEKKKSHSMEIKGTPGR